jgi:agarase
MIGQFRFAGVDRGLLSGGVPDQAARAAAHKEFMRGALNNPQIVGCTWWKFTDFPLTGRARDSANYNSGFVDIVDTPYPEMVAAAREIGKTMYKTRMDAK